MAVDGDTGTQRNVPKYPVYCCNPRTDSLCVSGKCLADRHRGRRAAVQYIPSHYGVDVNTAVRQFQGDFELPEEIGEGVKAFYEAMDRGDYQAAKQILDMISEKTAPEFPLVADMRAMYDIETEWPEE